MDLRKAQNCINQAWEDIWPENKPNVLLLEFMGSRYFTSKDSEYENGLYEFYSLDKGVYKANAGKIQIMYDDESEVEYYLLEGQYNLVVITANPEIDQTIFDIIDRFVEYTKTYD